MTASKSNSVRTVLTKIASKILLTPYAKSQFGKLCQFYETAQLESVRQISGRLRFKLYEVLQFGGIVDREQLDIKGEFPEEDCQALEKVVQTVAREQMMVAEIGSWTGMSTSILGKAVANQGGKVFAIDHWLGSEGVPHHKQAKAVDIYSIFKRNMILLGIWDKVFPLVMDSQTASEIFVDGILDLVFIDGDHRFEAVKADIMSWFPKVRAGGILCGHDCEGYYSEYSQEDKKMVEEHLEDDYITTANDYTPAVEAYVHNICHPGVVKALRDCLQERYSIMPNSTIWYYTK